MLYALVDNVKCDAVPHSQGKCPCCTNEVFSKCGEIRIWHWSHYKKATCDTWNERDTIWHKTWKSVFGKEVSEVVLEKHNERHFADIFTATNITIKLLSNSLPKKRILEMEKFYGDRLMWLINGENMLDVFELNGHNYLKRLLVIAKDTYMLEKDYVDEAYLDNKISGPIDFYLSRIPNIFYADRPKFLDFGGDYLFYIERFWGAKIGIGRFVSKRVFLKKYSS